MIKPVRFFQPTTRDKNRLEELGEDPNVMLDDLLPEMDDALDTPVRTQI